MVENFFRLLTLFVLFFVVFILVFVERKRFIGYLEVFRKRLFLGLPVGTFVVVSINILVYLLIQRGFWDPLNPLWLPFASNSFSNPVGMIISSWSHMGFDHLFSNMLGTIVFAPLAEMIFNTGARETRLFNNSFLGRFSSIPMFRAVFLFPLIWFVVGLVLSMSTPPGIGFSAVLFTIIGFCAVLAPLLIIFLLLANIILNNLVSVLLVPVEVTRVTTVIAEPSWAGIGIWAHLLGFLFGILLGVAYYFVRGGFKKPDPLYSFFAIFIVGLMMDLDLPFSYVVDGEYILYSAAGFILVLILATLVYLYWEYVDAENKKKSPLSRVKGKKTWKKLFSKKNIWRGSLLLILLSSLIISFTFAGAKLTMESPEVPEDAYEVEGYEFWFSQNNGVLVYEEDREIYTLVASTTDLISEKNLYLPVGGVGYIDKVNLTYSEIKTYVGDTVGSVWIDSKHGLENLYTDNTKHTGVELFGMDIYIGFDVENKSILVEGVGEDSFKTQLVEGEEYILDIEGEEVKIMIEEGEVKIISDEFAGTIAEITAPPPR